MEAMTVFGDVNAKMIDDDAHSEEEERFILLGLSSQTNILMVCHCYRDEYNAIRIISARKASRKETQIYKVK